MKISHHGEAVEDKYRKFQKHEMFQAVKKDMPKNANFSPITWTMKRKSSEGRRARW